MYEELIEELRTTERICRDRMDGEVMLLAADVIERLEDINEHYENIINKHERINGDLLEKAKAIAEKVPKWIPVTERLPKEQGEYLVYAIGGNWGQLSWFDIDYFNGTKFYGGHYATANPVAWMPLPKPPLPVMYYPQVDGITPTVITPKEEQT